MLLFTLILVAMAAFATAAPTAKRAFSKTDVDALHLALYLENLEANLFLRGCNGFQDVDYVNSGFPAGFQAEVCAVAQQEAFHATAIEELLEANGAPTVPACTYQFPYTTPKEFVQVANKVTTVGIGAYTGAVKNIADDSTLRETAASILAVEARHDAFLRMGIDLYPFPTTFDTGLTAVWAYNLAQPFIVSCPAPLDIVKLPSLQLIDPPPSPVAPGTPIQFSWNPDEFLIDVDPSTPLYMAGVAENVTDPIYAQVTKLSATSGTVPTPGDIPSGVVYVCLTTFAGGQTMQDLTDWGTLAGPLEIMAS